MDLKGAVALVTGGNGGPGQRICHALAKEGAQIAVVYAQSRDQAEGVTRELASRHQVDAAAFACELSDGAAVGTLVADVADRFGRIDILVNDAGVPDSFVPTVEQPLPHRQRLIDIHLIGTYLVSKTVAPHTMREVRERLRPLGVTPTVGTVDEFPANFAGENPKWREVIRSRNIRVQ